MGGNIFNSFDNKELIFLKYTPLFISYKKESCLKLDMQDLATSVTPLYVLGIIGPDFRQKSDSQHLVLLILPAFSAERKHRAQGRPLRPDIIASEYLLSSPIRCSIDHACSLCNARLNFSKKSIPNLLCRDFPSYSTFGA